MSGARATVRKAMPVRIVKRDEVRQIAYSVVLEPRSAANPDSQGDWYTAEDIEKAAHRWLGHVAKGDGWGDVMHDEATRAGVPVESFIAPVDFGWGDGDRVEVVKAGSWVVGMFYEDADLWARVEAGEFDAVSVGGSGTRI